MDSECISCGYLGTESYARLHLGDSLQVRAKDSGQDFVQEVLVGQLALEKSSFECIAVRTNQLHGRAIDEDNFVLCNFSGGDRVDHLCSAGPEESVHRLLGVQCGGWRGACHPCCRRIVRYTYTPTLYIVNMDILSDVTHTQSQSRNVSCQLKNENG